MEEAKKKKKWSCERSGNVFSSRDCRDRHRRNHDGRNRFQCPRCGRVFSRKDNHKKRICIGCDPRPVIERKATLKEKQRKQLQKQRQQQMETCW